jgi:pyruvate dehydrogenase E2 component (dihydrolipoamide acetyltransferase)
VSNLEEMMRQRKVDGERLEREAPDLFNGFNALMKHYYKPGVLSRREKELMAITASVATRCVPCLANHANNAIAAGATREQVLEAASVGVEFGGGPAFAFVRENLLKMLDDMPVGALTRLC